MKCEICKKEIKDPEQKLVGLCRTCYIADKKRVDENLKRLNADNQQPIGGFNEMECPDEEMKGDRCPGRACSFYTRHPACPNYQWLSLPVKRQDKTKPTGKTKGK